MLDYQPTPYKTFAIALLVLSLSKISLSQPCLSCLVLSCHIHFLQKISKKFKVALTFTQLGLLTWHKFSQKHSHPPWGLAKKEDFVLKTNLKNKGLISIDRSNKATLQFTIPRSIIKSSARDLSPLIFLYLWGNPNLKIPKELVFYLYYLNIKGGNNHRFQHGFWLRGVQP